MKRRKCKNYTEKLVKYQSMIKQLYFIQRIYIELQPWLIFRQVHVKFVNAKITEKLRFHIMKQENTYIIYEP